MFLEEALGGGESGWNGGYKGGSGVFLLFLVCCMSPISS